jgi:hypothetical protein
MQAGVIRKQEIAAAISRIAEHRVIARVRYDPGPDPGIVDLVVERVSFGGGARGKAN